MMKSLTFSLCAAATLCGGAAAQQLPDVSVSNLAQGWNYYGQSGGLAAYSFATTSCNVGNVVINWIPPWDMPVIGQNVFRIVDGQIEQLGYSFLKDSFCAVSEPTCGTCIPTPCATLGIGCADTYGAGLNDGANGWAKWGVDATRGEWSTIPASPVGALPLRGRLQIEVAKIGTSNAVYVAESQYVSGHDQQAGLGQNNQSWRYISLNSPSAPFASGPVQMFEPGIMAWQDTHADVRIEEANVIDEGGPGIHGFMWVGSKATDLGNGMWRYDYAIQNTTSERCVGSISISAACTGLTFSNAQFRGIAHHSGSPYSDAPWTMTQSGNSISWTTEDYAQNPNANAVRWGTLYSFSFETDAGPLENGGSVTLGLFEPGTPSSLTVPAIIPSGQGFEVPAFCTPNNTSLGGPIDFVANGSPVIANNDFMFECFNVPPFNFGYFLMSQDQAFVQPPGSQGNLCLGGSIVRFAQDVQNSGILGYVIFSPDANNLPNNVTWMPGETWNFQYWSRDGATSNLSNLQTINFCQ